MRRALLFIASSSVMMQAYAQSTLTKANNGYVVGTTFQISTTNLTGGGADGNGISWDMSANSQSGNSTANMLAPSATTAGSSFTMSNVAVSTGGGTLYYDVNNNGLFHWGLEGGGAKFVMTNPEEQLRYPMTVGTSYTDDWTGLFTAPSFSAQRGGTTTVTCNSYGTLILPQGTFTNVLKVKQEQNYADTLNGIPVLTYDVEITQWLSPDQHYILASYTSSSFTNPFSYINSSSNPTGIGQVMDMEDIVSVYPNPATDYIRMKATSNIRLKKVFLTDLSGKIMQEWTNIADLYQSGLNISHLPAASYILHAESIEGYKAGTIIVKK